MSTGWEWQDEAACKGMDVGLFYHGGDGAELALEACGRCDVQGTCLEWAVEHGERGIWGATTEAERRSALRRRQRRAQRQAVSA